VEDNYFEFGELIDGTDPELLKIQLAKTFVDVVKHHKAFTLIELRCIHNEYSEILVVDCRNDNVWTKNPVGIKPCERLALRFFSDLTRMPEVRALRKNFPAVIHLNHVLMNEPKSLCLYLDLWPNLQRTWTPQKQLNRILDWLELTATQKLHLEDQPLEQIFFKGKFELVLPADFDEKVDENNFLLTVSPTHRRNNLGPILKGKFEEATQVVRENIPAACFVLTLTPVVHGVENMPNTLGELEKLLSDKGASIIKNLYDQIKLRASQGGISKSSESYTLLVLHIPIVKEIGEAPLRFDVQGVIINSGLADLGVALDALQEVNGRYQPFTLLSDQAALHNWRNISIEPMECISPFTESYARLASGLTSEGPNVALVGLGALGSAMSNIWTREGWGTLSLIDPDYIKPHNLARHIAYEFQIGAYKVDAVNELIDNTYSTLGKNRIGLPLDARDFNNNEISDALKINDLIIDVTTTLEFPRDISVNLDIKRAVSVFLTPSGLDSIMLIEDDGRKFTLDVLEAIYYRSILNYEWGENHLLGNFSHLRIGGGCRDVSKIMSLELVNVHAAVLARQIRLRFEESTAAIKVWHSNADTGEITQDSIPLPSAIYIIDHGSWKIVWDEDIRLKLQAIRQTALPKETGGVLIGYYDLKLMMIYIVDVIPAPSDSKADQTGFERGKDGLSAAIRNVEKRTANIVSYIGEWHSHPDGVAARPSGDDINLLAYLTLRLKEDGLPAVMLIVGEFEENFILATGI